MIESRKVKQKIYYLNEDEDLKRDKWIMITEWACGEGYDIELKDNNEVQRFSLHINHFDIIKFLIDGWHVFEKLEKNK